MGSLAFTHWPSDMRPAVGKDCVGGPCAPGQGQLWPSPHPHPRPVLSPSLHQDPPQQPEVLLPGERVDARALGQAIELEDGHVEAEEVIQGGSGEPQAQVEVLPAVMEAQEPPGLVEGQPLGQAKAQRGMGLPGGADAGEQSWASGLHAGRAAPHPLWGSPETQPHLNMRFLFVLSPSHMAHWSILLRNGVDESWLVFRLSSNLSQTHGTPWNRVGFTSRSVSIREPCTTRHGGLPANPAPALSPPARLWGWVCEALSCGHGWEPCRE